MEAGMELKCYGHKKGKRIHAGMVYWKKKNGKGAQNRGKSIQGRWMERDGRCRLDTLGALK